MLSRLRCCRRQRALALVSLLLSLTVSAVPSAAPAPPKQELHAAFTKPTSALPQVDPTRVVPENIIAVALVYAASRQEKAGLFVAGDRITQDFKSKKLELNGAAGDAVKTLAARQWPLGMSPASSIRFVAELIGAQFNAIVESSKQQMDSYSDLVSSVASSVDAFAKDNVSSADERDYLSEQGVAASNGGYGASQFAAAQLTEHAHEITHVVQQRAVQKAYDAKDAEDLIAKLSGRPRSVVVGELARAKLGEQILRWLANSRGNGKPSPPSAAIRAAAKKWQQLGGFYPRKRKPGAKAPWPKAMCLFPSGLKPCPKATAKK